MKKLSLLSIITVIFFLNSNAQSKQQPKKLIIEVDSADAIKFLTVLQVGINNLMTTDIPANQVVIISNYAAPLYEKQAAIYNSWIPKQPANKPDSTIKK